jgi:hypothetical protein
MGIPVQNPFDPLTVLMNNPNSPDPSIAQIISSLLQTDWTLASPGVKDITWATTRFDAAQDVPANFIISCYNPAGPATVEQLSREALQILEDVVVDIIVKVSAGTAIAISTRESIRQQVYSILQANQLNVPTCNDVWPLREKDKVESPELMRLTIMFRCRSFKITT